jgi:hypothetical protein
MARECPSKYAPKSRVFRRIEKKHLPKERFLNRVEHRRRVMLGTQPLGRKPSVRQNIYHIAVSRKYPAIARGVFVRWVFEAQAAVKRVRIGRDEGIEHVRQGKL